MALILGSLHIGLSSSISFVSSVSNSLRGIAVPKINVNIGRCKDQIRLL